MVLYFSKPASRAIHPIVVFRCSTTPASLESRMIPNHILGYFQWLYPFRILVVIGTAKPFFANLLIVTQWKNLLTEIRIYKKQDFCLQDLN